MSQFDTVIQSKDELQIFIRRLVKTQEDPYTILYFSIADYHTPDEYEVNRLVVITLYKMGTDKQGQPMVGDTVLSTGTQEIKATALKEYQDDMQKSIVSVKGSQTIYHAAIGL